MVAHFICTNGDFPYFFYLTIKTTLKVCSFDKIILWCIGKKPQNNYYFNELEPQIEVLTSLPPGLTANSARYLILYEKGGFYMDWDAIAIRDIVPVLSDKNYITFFQTEYGWDFLKFNPDSSPASILTCGYIYIKKQSLMMQEALRSVKNLENLMELSPSCKAFYGIISKNRKYWKVKHSNIVNPFWYHADSFKEDKNLTYPNITCIDHWYYSNHPDFREKITPEFIRTSQCLFARTVRKIL